MKKYLVYFLIFVFSIGIVFADAGEFAEAKKIIDAKTPCSQLTESQLEIIGDYLMEQMHPGQAHETMDKMMGGEGSASLKLMHISIAKRIYCSDINDAANYGMMGTTIGLNYGGMMNMMGSGFFGTNMMGYGSEYGMMGGLGYGYWSFFNLLFLLFLIGIVVLVYLWIMKLWKEVFKKAK